MKWYRWKLWRFAWAALPPEQDDWFDYRITDEGGQWSRWFSRLWFRTFERRGR